MLLLYPLAEGFNNYATSSVRMLCITLMFSNKVRSSYRFEARLLSTSSGRNMALQKGGERRAATVGSKEYDEASTIPLTEYLDMMSIIPISCKLRVSHMLTKPDDDKQLCCFGGNLLLRCLPANPIHSISDPGSFLD